MSEKAIAKKAFEVEALAEKINASASVVVVDYLGLTVAEVTALRQELHNNQCEFKVIKNNITRRAVQTTGHEGLVDHLTGPNAIAFSTEDSVTAAKVLFNFAKEHKNLELKAGIVDGVYVSTEGIQQIAQLPSREDLLTMIAGGILQPIKNVAIGLSLHIENLENQEG